MIVVSAVCNVSAQTASLPELTAPVNDFAHVIDADNADAIDKMSRALKAASGDVVVVATVPDINGYGDINEYAVKLFENHGKGIGDKGKNNGLLIVLAVKERVVKVEVGYELEQWITDGFAGETIRLVMMPSFRGGDYGTGLRAGTARIVARIAQGRNVTLPREVQAPASSPTPFTIMMLVFFAILIISRIARRGPPGVRRWGRGGWSGWSSGVGPFGGGWGGGFGGGGGGGGGFGGGFGGFGGGSSGGGGASGSW